MNFITVNAMHMLQASMHKTIFTPSYRNRNEILHGLRSAASKYVPRSRTHDTEYSSEEIARSE
jgi:hypothetical protein